eukprot:2760245-Amphidinium_carterae.1
MKPSCMHSFTIGRPKWGEVVLGLKDLKHSLFKRAKAAKAKVMDNKEHMAGDATNLGKRHTYQGYVIYASKQNFFASGCIQAKPTVANKTRLYEQ